MPVPQTMNEVIASALSLPVEQRLAVLDAIHVSLADPAVDHGPREPHADVAVAWRDEIARRLADLQEGRVKTIPAEKAEQMIRGDANPAV